MARDGIEVQLTASNANAADQTPLRDSHDATHMRRRAG
jgi:hypothetical protein